MHKPSPSASANTGNTAIEKAPTTEEEHTCQKDEEEGEADLAQVEAAVAAEDARPNPPQPQQKN